MSALTSLIIAPRRHWRAISPTTPLASSRTPHLQPSFQTYSPIHAQPQQQQLHQPSSLALPSTASTPSIPVPVPPLSSAPYASHSLPLPSFPLPDLHTASLSMTAFEAQAASAAAAADHISALAAEDVMNSLRFVSVGAVGSSTRQQQEHSSTRQQQEHSSTKQQHEHSSTKQQHEHFDLQLPHHQQRMQRLLGMSLSDAMQPLDAVSYSEDKTMVSAPPPPLTPLPLFAHSLQFSEPSFQALASKWQLQPHTAQSVAAAMEEVAMVAGVTQNDAAAALHAMLPLPSSSSSSSALPAAAAATTADADVAPMIHITHAPKIESSPSINALHSRPSLSQSPDSLAFASSQSPDSLKSSDCSDGTHHLKQQQQHQHLLNSPSSHVTHATPTRAPVPVQDLSKLSDGATQTTPVRSSSNATASGTTPMTPHLSDAHTSTTPALPRATSHAATTPIIPCAMAHAATASPNTLFSSPAASAAGVSLSQSAAAGGAAALSPLDVCEVEEQKTRESASFGAFDHHSLLSQQQQQLFSTSCSSLRLRTTPVGYGCKANIAGDAAAPASCCCVFLAAISSEFIQQFHAFARHPVTLFLLSSYKPHAACTAFEGRAGTRGRQLQRARHAV